MTAALLLAAHLAGDAFVAFGTAVAVILALYVAALCLLWLAVFAFLVLDNG